MLRYAGYTGVNVVGSEMDMKTKLAVLYLFLRHTAICRQMPVILAVCAGIFAMSGMCGCEIPTYPKENLEKRVKDLVEKEYGHKVKVKVVGKTFGIYLPLSQIQTYDQSITESFEKKSQNIFLTAIRVCLSTDADIDYFVTIYTDKSKGSEYWMVRSVEDSKRLLLGTISRNDYYERTVYKAMYSMPYLAEKIVRAMLQDIPVKHSGASLYFLPGDEFNNSFWFRYLMESELKDDIKYSVIDLKAKQLSALETLVYVKARETFIPKAGYEQYPFSFPSGTVHEWMFELRAIFSIIPMIVKSYVYKDVVNGRVITPAMIPPFSEHSDVSLWEDDFYMTDMTRTEFIINQVSSKLNKKIREAEDPDTKPREDDFERLEPPIEVAVIEAQFVDGDNEYTGSSKSFQLIYRFKEGIANPELTDQIRDYSLKIFKRVLKKYDYTDYNELLLLSGDGRLLNSFDKKSIDALELSDSNWKSLLRPTQY